MLVKCPNFLILDVLTNDLDLDTIEALEEMLEDFDGGVIVVSHDGSSSTTSWTTSSSSRETGSSTTGPAITPPCGNSSDGWRRNASPQRRSPATPTLTR